MLPAAEAPAEPLIETEKALPIKPACDATEKGITRAAYPATLAAKHV